MHSRLGSHSDLKEAYNEFLELSKFGQRNEEWIATEVEDMFPSTVFSHERPAKFAFGLHAISAMIRKGKDCDNTVAVKSCLEKYKEERFRDYKGLWIALNAFAPSQGKTVEAKV